MTEEVKQEQDEPVAYFNPQEGGFYWAKPTTVTAPVTIDVEPLPLYTTPQGCDECGVGGGYALYCVGCVEKFFGNKEWVSLTDEEIQECLQGLPTQTIDVYARRIEAKLKEVNGFE